MARRSFPFFFSVAFFALLNLTIFPAAFSQESPDQGTREIQPVPPEADGRWRFRIPSRSFFGGEIRYAFVDHSRLTLIDRSVRRLRSLQREGKLVLGPEPIVELNGRRYRTLSLAARRSGLRILLDPDGRVFSWSGKGSPRYLMEVTPSALFDTPDLWADLLNQQIPTPPLIVSLKGRRNNPILEVAISQDVDLCLGFTHCDRVGIVWWRGRGSTLVLRRERATLLRRKEWIGAATLLVRGEQGSPQPAPTITPPSEATPPPTTLTPTTAPTPTSTGSILTKIAAQSLQMPARPPTRGFTTERTLGNLSFNVPVAVVAAPGETDRLFVVEKAGRVIQVSNLSGTPTKSTFLDITTRVGDSSGEQGLLAITFHPNYAQNGFFYLWYTLSTTTSAGTGRHDRLARYSVSSNPNVANSASETPLISQFDEESNHNGGEIAFGPDGYLYLSTGDEGGGGDSRGNSRRIDRDFFSAVLRIDVDSKPGSLAPNAHPAVHSGTYRIPADNPFLGATSFNGSVVSPANVRTEFWAVGLRNPFRMSFDRVTGDLWLGDVGQSAREEVNLIVRGGDYGWNYREGSIAYTGTVPNGVVLRDPVWDYDRNQGTTVTGGIVYRGSAISQIYGHYVFADYGSGRIWSLIRQSGSTPQVTQLTTDAGIVSFGTNPANGDILLVDIQEGAIKRLVYNSASIGTPIPNLLSATGAFSSTTSLIPAPGVVEYNVNTSFWSDHAEKRRWFALPSLTSSYGFNSSGNWNLPTGAVWVKHFDLEMTRGDPGTKRRIETRLIVKTSDGIYGTSYRWNTDQTDATLVPEEGANLDLTISDNGQVRTQRWRFPGRSECQTCHTSQGGFALSFNTRQLNRDRTYPTGTLNQLDALARAGYLDTASIPAPGSLPALSAASDLSRPVEHRARSFLDANCSSCHQPGGNALGMWDARISTPLASAGIVNGSLIDSGGDPTARVLVPQDPSRSRLLHRVAGSNGVVRMPPLGSNERNLQGEALLLEWINSVVQ